MDALHQSFINTIQSITKHMETALAIAQQGPNQVLNVKAAEKILDYFSNIIKNVSHSYNQLSDTLPQVRAGTSVTQNNSWNASIHPKKHSNNNCDDDDVINAAIQEAMNIEASNSSLDQSGGVEFKPNSNTAMKNAPIQSNKYEWGNSDSEDSSIDIETLPPGQQLNHEQNSDISQAFKSAAFFDNTIK